MSVCAAVFSAREAVPTHLPLVHSKFPFESLLPAVAWNPSSIPSHTALSLLSQMIGTTVALQ